MFFNRSLHAKSSFIKNLISPLGLTVVGNVFDTDDLVRTKCQVVIQHKEKDGATYANVAAVLRNRPAGKPAAAAESF